MSAAAESQLSHEARARPRQGVVAAIAALLLVAAVVAQLAGPQSKTPELTVALIFVNRRFPQDLIASVGAAMGLIGLVWSLSFLFGAARLRRPEMNPGVRIAALAGGGLSAIVIVVTQIVLAIKAHQFVQTGEQTYEQANHLVSSAALPALQTLHYLGEAVLAVGIVMIALNAMRVGLLTRFMGYFGILVGVAGVLLIDSPPAIALQIFWLAGLAVLFAGRWPNGDPPSWRTGRAEPWPSSLEMREQRMKAAGESGAKPARPARTAERSGAASSTSDSGAPARTRSATPKRKRKRRR